MHSGSSEGQRYPNGCDEFVPVQAHDIVNEGLAEVEVGELALQGALQELERDAKRAGDAREGGLVEDGEAVEVVVDLEEVKEGDGVDLARLEHLLERGVDHKDHLAREADTCLRVKTREYRERHCRMH